MSEQPTPTPRTDAEAFEEITERYDNIETKKHAGGYAVPADFARQLERELAAAHQSIERLTLDLKNSRTNFRAAIDACTELRDEKERLKRTLIHLRCDECDERALAQKGARP